MFICCPIMTAGCTDAVWFFSRSQFHPELLVLRMAQPLGKKTRGKPNFCQSLHEKWTKFSSFLPWILAHFIILTHLICPFKMDIFSGEVSEITLQLRHCRNPQLRQP
jgi:hypothetical protein